MRKRLSKGSSGRFEGDGSYCVDIDECILDYASCHYLACTRRCVVRAPDVAKVLPHAWQE
jgi:hypothetical protein